MQTCRTYQGRPLSEVVHSRLVVESLRSSHESSRVSDPSSHESSRVSGPSSHESSRVNELQLWVESSQTSDPSRVESSHFDISTSQFESLLYHDLGRTCIARWKPFRPVHLLCCTSIIIPYVSFCLDFVKESTVGLNQTNSKAVPLWPLKIVPFLVRH